MIWFEFHIIDFPNYDYNRQNPKYILYIVMFVKWLNVKKNIFKLFHTCKDGTK